MKDAFEITAIAAKGERTLFDSITSSKHPSSTEVQDLQLSSYLYDLQLQHVPD